MFLKSFPNDNKLKSPAFLSHFYTQKKRVNEFLFIKLNVCVDN